jgi:hypothetical protein
MKNKPTTFSTQKTAWDIQKNNKITKIAWKKSLRFPLQRNRRQ